MGIYVGGGGMGWKGGGVGDALAGIASRFNGLPTDELNGDALINPGTEQD